MEAGPEVGVASTKAFTSMVLCHYLFGLAVGHGFGRVTGATYAAAIDSLKALPSAVDRAVNAAGLIEEVASKFYEASNFIFIGRGPSFMVALEGALKLKEISYIHAEGYAGGELKHGPIALIDRHMPVLAVVPHDMHYEKMISNVEEVRAREGQIIGVGDIQDERLRGLSSEYIPCPQVKDAALQSILSVIPLQLLSYYIAVKRGTDVDQPRNLAKSVTVE
jgi:glucosamine--fructose-6-phosphate aminotransferase (isomerizing)